MGRPKTPAIERFWAKVEKTDDCWMWTAQLDRDGYGRFSTDRRTLAAHRWVYEALVGPIPEGLTLDHVCHSKVAEECASLPEVCAHRRCVNPAHLEPITRLENTRRGGKGRKGFGGGEGHGRGGGPKRTCLRGHEWTPENTIYQATGRLCRTCRTQYLRDRYQRLRLQAKAA